MTKTAFIAIVGCPNVGKSSILNKIMGTKIAIVSSKPQTTRTKIMGVLTEGDIQLVFTDTPGYHKPHNKLGEKMNQAVGDSIGGVDACLFVVESKGDIKKGEYELLEKFKNLKVPVILAINKIDMIKDKEELLERIVQLNSLFDFEAIVPVSALKGKNTNELIHVLKKVLPHGPQFYDEDTITDQPERQIVAELVREQALRQLDKEIPHGIAVVIDRMKERPDGSVIDIDATIICERDSHKGIIIGKQGAMLKSIGSKARVSMEKLLDTKVNLKLWVKVKKDWRDSDTLLRNYGYRDEN